LKLVTYEIERAQKIGRVSDGGIVDIGRQIGINSMHELLSSGRLAEVAAFEDLKPDHLLTEIKFSSVVPDPRHIYCVGVNYSDHLQEVLNAGIPRTVPKQPSLFIRFAETLIGHEQPLIIPRVSRQLDFEAELAIIIGTGGRYIAKDRALSHIAGYACFNDGSVRDWQFHTSQVTSGKNFMGTGAFGPWMVTADEVPDAAALDIKLILNGQVLQSSNTRHLIFDIPTIISYASALVPLVPGDVIATGTPAGVGFSRNPPVFMKEGDICEVQIERIGTLRNPVKNEAGKQ
jgi:2-keto-4-pentenoate hydratase/2-oxohepta-3-ene-1,7-dioic acid hydratase in catechol pathway